MKCNVYSFAALSAGLIFYVSNIFAQSPWLKQVIVLNEGPFGGPVTVGTYNPSTKTYQNFITLPARFATDVIVDNEIIYVAADTLLVKFDGNTLQLIAQTTVKGVRELAVWNDQLLVTRGDYGYVPNYFQVYDKNTLNLVYELNTLSGDAAEVKVLNDTAYVAVNDFGNMGKIAIIDLNGQTLNREIDLGADGFNPEALRVQGNRIITVNNLNWTNSSITDYDASSGTFQTTLLNTASSCGASALAIGNVYFQVAGEKNLGVFNIYNKTVWDTLYLNKSIYGLGVEPLSGNFYAGTTDYVSFGKVFIFTIYGAILDSFEVDISPGTFAFDIRSGVGQNELQSAVPGVRIFPNPVNGSATIEISRSIGNGDINLELFDVFGKKVYNSQIINQQSKIILDDLASGIYWYKVKSGDETVNTGKFVVE